MAGEEKSVNPSIEGGKILETKRGETRDSQVQGWIRPRRVASRTRPSRG